MGIHGLLKNQWFLPAKFIYKLDLSPKSKNF